jgi:hypothetical protein
LGWFNCRVVVDASSKGAEFAGLRGCTRSSPDGTDVVGLVDGCDGSCLILLLGNALMNADNADVLVVAAEARFGGAITPLDFRNIDLGSDEGRLELAMRSESALAASSCRSSSS